jgi:hypothetical protein
MGVSPRGARSATLKWKDLTAEREEDIQMSNSKSHDAWFHTQCTQYDGFRSGSTDYLAYSAARSWLPPLFSLLAWMIADNTMLLP